MIISGAHFTITVRGRVEISTATRQATVIRIDDGKHYATTIATTDMHFLVEPLGQPTGGRA